MSFLSDEAVRALVEPFTGEPAEEHDMKIGREHLAKIFAVIEGEKKCERCDGTGFDGVCNEPNCEFHQFFSSDNRLKCEPCKGTGTVPADPLVKLSEIVARLNLPSNHPGIGGLWNGPGWAEVLEREFGGKR